MSVRDPTLICDRCGRELYNSWEDGWPNHGLIDLGLSCQVFAALRDKDTTVDADDFAWWHVGHPAITRNEAQRVTFQWVGYGDGYRLCRDCQRTLLRVVGKFFGIPDWKPEAKP